MLSSILAALSEVDNITEHRGSAADTKAERQWGVICAFLCGNEYIANGDVQKLLKVSSPTANRILNRPGSRCQGCTGCPCEGTGRIAIIFSHQPWNAFGIEGNAFLNDVMDSNYNDCGDLSRACFENFPKLYKCVSVSLTARIIYL